MAAEPKPSCHEDGASEEEEQCKNGGGVVEENGDRAGNGDEDKKDEKEDRCIACVNVRKMGRLYYGLCARRHRNPMHKKHLRGGEYHCVQCVHPIVGLVAEEDMCRVTDPTQWKRVTATWKGLRTRRDRIQMRMSSRHIPDRLGKRANPPTPPTPPTSPAPLPPSVSSSPSSSSSSSSGSIPNR